MCKIQQSIQTNDPHPSLCSLHVVTYTWELPSAYSWL